MHKCKKQQQQVTYLHTQMPVHQGIWQNSPTGCKKREEVTFLHKCTCVKKKNYYLRTQMHKCKKTSYLLTHTNAQVFKKKSYFLTHTNAQV